MEQILDTSEKARYYLRVLRQRPSALARVRGSAEYPAIRGSVSFYQTPEGVLVSAQVFGLPAGDGPCGGEVFAFHIHGGASCTGDREDPFRGAGSHYDPDDCAHPRHAGDLPPLFGNRGQAFAAFLTDRFTVREVLGKTVILHRDPDDFTTQPSGRAGTKIACGRIESCAGGGISCRA